MAYFSLVGLKDGHLHITCFSLSISSSNNLQNLPVLGMWDIDSNFNFLLVKKLWAGLLFFEHYEACKHPYASVSVWIFHEMTVIGHILQKWILSLSGILVLDHICCCNQLIPFIILMRCKILTRWLVLNFENIVTEPLRHLSVSSSFCLFYYQYFLWCFKSLMLILWGGNGSNLVYVIH